MKATIYIPNHGWMHYEVYSIEQEKAALLEKYPQHAKEIIVRPARQSRGYSLEEIKAMEEGE